MLRPFGWVILSGGGIAGFGMDCVPWIKYVLVGVSNLCYFGSQFNLLLYLINLYDICILESKDYWN